MTRCRDRLLWVLIAGLPAAFLAVFFIWPVTAMLGRGFFEAGTFDLSVLREVVGNARTWKILWQTVWMALAGTFISVVLGVPAAYVLYRCDFPGRLVLRSIVTVPFVLPTVVVGVAFRALLNGPYAFLGLDGTVAAVVLAMVFFNLSVVVRTVGGLWAGLDPRATEAAQTLGASPVRVWWTVTFPALGPAIAAAASIVFLFCSTAYGIVQTLGRPGYGTLETEIWVQTTTYLDLRTGAILSLFQLIIVVLAVAVSRKLTAASETALTFNAGGIHRIRRGDLPAFFLTIVVAALLILAPLLALVGRSFRQDGHWTLENYWLLASAGEGFSGGTSPLEAVGNSLKIAVWATVISLVVGLALAVVLSRPVRSKAKKLGQKVLDFAALLPLGVSAVTLGFGFFVALSGPPLNLSETQWMVPLAQALVALPLVLRLLLPTLRAIDPRLREAAQTLGSGPWRVIFRVDCPFIGRSIALAAGFAFATSLGEFGATSFLATGDNLTLPTVIVRLLSRPGAHNYGMALAAAVILALGAASVMAACEWWNAKYSTAKIGAIRGER